MQTQFRNLDFTGQNIYAGIDVHKKSWQVSIYSSELYHKTFNQPPKPEVLHSYLGFADFLRLNLHGVDNVVITLIKCGQNARKSA